jgi:hypothetical protein
MHPAGRSGRLVLRRVVDEQRQRPQRVTDRIVDDYFRDAVAMSAPTSEGIVDDSWRSPFVIEGAQQSSAGFNWGDAGIGGAAAVALVLLGAGGVVLIRDGRRQKVHG